QLDHPAADLLLGWGAPRWGAGFAGRGEQVQLAGAVVADQVDHRPAGVAEQFTGLLVAEPVDEVRPQRLVAAVGGPLPGRGRPPPRQGRRSWAPFGGGADWPGGAARGAGGPVWRIVAFFV